MTGDDAIRRSWRRYLVVLVAIAVVVAGLGALLISRTDLVHVDYSPAARTATAGGTTPAVRTPAAAVRALWSRRGVPPAGATASALGAVLTADSHGITGHDVGTGRTLWSYRRSDTTLCRWIVLPTVAVTVFHDATDCSDITGFDPRTGARMWFLNADLGQLRYAVAAPSILLLADHNRVRAFYEQTGGEAWNWHQKGCRIGDLSAGDIGATLTYTCTTGESSLLVLDSWTGKKKWTAPVTGVAAHLLGASSDLVVLATVSNRPAVLVYDSNGRARATIRDPRLHNEIHTTQPPAQLSEATMVGYDGHNAIGVDLSGLRISWSVPASGPPAVDGFDVLVPGASGATVRSGPTGDIVDGGTVRGPVGADLKAVSRVGARIVAVTAYRTTVLG